jgi:hypothetical protein
MFEQWRSVCAASTVCAEDTFGLLSQASDLPESRVCGSGDWSIEVLGSGRKVSVHAGDLTAHFVVAGQVPRDASRARLARSLLGLAEKGRVLAQSPDGIRLELKVRAAPVRVPGQIDVKGGNLCVRELGADHAFIAHPNGRAWCGHVFPARRLQNWLNAAARIGTHEGAALLPCPECSAAGECIPLLLVGGDNGGAGTARKRPRAEKPPPFEMDAWKLGAEKAKEQAGSDVDARKEAAVVAIEKLSTAPKAKMQITLVGKSGVAGLLVGDEEEAAAEFLKRVDLWPTKGGWGGVTVVPYSILLTATVFDLPLDSALIDLFASVAWHAEARVKQEKIRKRAREAKEERAAEREEELEEVPEPAVIPGAGEEEEEFVMELPAGRDTMKRKVNDEAGKRPELNFTIYSRDRCGEQIIRELSVGELSSYQKVVQWAAGRLGDTAATAPQGLLLDHDTGAGKTVSLWLTLGVAWSMARVNQVAPGMARKPMPDGYKPKILFATSRALWQKRDPAKDVWAFYKGAGPDAYDQIRATVAAAEKKGEKLSKGSRWELLYPAEGTRDRTRVISFLQLHNALLGQNHIGKAIYGYEVVNNRKGNRFVDLLDKPAENRIRGDELVDLLHAEGSFRRLDVAVLEKELKDAKTPQARQAAQTQLDLAKDGSANPLDPLRDAVIVIDEADLLFKADNEIGNRVELIERAIFHSYRVSGKNAVRLVLGTATPAHTDLRSTFRLLNVLVVDPAQRVHGVGTPDTVEGANPGIAELAGDSGTFMTSKMTTFVKQLRNGISRVNVTQDTDHFPKRARADVPVAVPGAFAADYNAQLRKRVGRVVAPGGEADGRIGAPAGEGDPDFDPFAEADARDAAASRAAEKSTASADATSEGAVDDDYDEQQAAAQLSLSTQQLKGIQQALATRANNLRRNAMLLPGRTSRPVPATHRLGHKDFSRAAVEQEIVDGGMPKMDSMLAKIAEIDRQRADANLPLPKHAIITATPGDYGATLIGASLAAAGYYWRPMRRDPDARVGISFVHPSVETEGEAGPWRQHAPVVSPQGLLPHPVDAQNAAFVVLHDSLLDMNLERDFVRTPRAGYRSYSDYVVANKTRLGQLIHAQPGADPMEAGAVDTVLNEISRRPIYVDPNDKSTFYTRSRISEGAQDMMSALADANAILPPSVAAAGARGLTLEILMDAGIIEWVPTLTRKQQEVAGKAVTDAFNDRETNFEGELARIIVISPAFATGIDLADVEYVHMIDPTERVAEGEGGVARTRDRIQAEGRAWRRCGHKGLRQRVFGGQDTTVTILSYLLDSQPFASSEILDSIRSRRPSVLRGEDEPEGATMRGHDAVVAALIRDPAEQQALVNIRDIMAANAFDSVVSTPQMVSAPVYTGYVTTEDDVPLYRMPGAQTEFVTVDGQPWPPSVGPGVRAATLLELWAGVRVRYEPRLASVAGVADVEQEQIELQLLGEIEAGFYPIVAEQKGTPAADASITAVRADEMHDLLMGAAKIAPYRKYLEDAYRVLGIRVLFDTARVAALAAFDKDDKTWFLQPFMSAYLRSKYVDGVPFNLVKFLQVALLRDAAGVGKFLSDGGQPLERVLMTAARMDAGRIGDLVRFFVKDWGLGIDVVLNAIGNRPKVPGETDVEYRMALFQALSSNRFGRWLRLAQAAQDIFVPEGITESTARTRARARVNIALAIAAARDYNIVDPIDRSSGAGPMHDRAWALLGRLDQDKDFANYTIARQFAIDYIEDLRSSATPAPTPLYSRMARMARRLNLTEYLADLVAYYMMFRVVAVAEQKGAAKHTAVSATPSPEIEAEGGAPTARRRGELEPALLLFIVQRVAGGDLMRHLDQFSDSRNGTGLDIVNDGVRALLESDADWTLTAAKLAEKAQEGENDTGLVILEGAPAERFANGGGQALFHRFDTFDRANRRASLSYYQAGTTKTVQVDNVEGKSWPESLGIWLSNCSIRVDDMRKAAAMFDNADLREAVRVAVVTMLNDSIPRPDSGRARANALIVGELVRAAGAGTLKLDCNTIRMHFDAIWQTASSPLDGDSFFAQSKDAQRNLLGIYGRTAGSANVRLWDALLQIADAMHTLFSAGIPDVRRRAMHALAQQTTFDAFVDADAADPAQLASLIVLPPLRDVWAETDPARYHSAAVAGAAMVDGIGKARAAEREQVVDVTVTVESLIQWYIANWVPFPTVVEAHTIMQREEEINTFLRTPTRQRVRIATIETLSAVEQFVHWAQFVAGTKGEMAASAQAPDEDQIAELEQATAKHEAAKAALDAEEREVATATASAEQLGEDAILRFQTRLEAACAQLNVLLQVIEQSEDVGAIAELRMAQQILEFYIAAHERLLPPGEDVEMVMPGSEEGLFGEFEALPVGAPVLQHVAELPMRITAPAHLCGEVIPASVARKLVWRKPANEDDTTLCVATGFAKLPSGAVLNAWKDGRILAERFG